MVCVKVREQIHEQDPKENKKKTVLSKNHEVAVLWIKILILNSVLSVLD